MAIVLERYSQVSEDRVQVHLIDGRDSEGTRKTTCLDRAMSVLHVANVQVRSGCVYVCLYKHYPLFECWGWEMEGVRN